MQANVVLHPLRCASCGGLLPLGQGATARCRYCGRDTVLPPEYVKLQLSARGFHDDKQLARQLYGRIGKPPGWLVRGWGQGAERAAGIAKIVGPALVMVTVGNPYIGIALLTALVYLLGYPVSIALRPLMWELGAPAGFVNSIYPILAATMLLLVLLVGVPAVLFTRERALAPVRRDIHASLAAGLPERPGGPSRCRSCGAALDVPKGVLGVACPYCQADNLVALPAAWVSHLRASEFHHFLRIDAAQEAYRRVSIEAQDSLWRMALGFVFVFPLVMFLGWILEKMQLAF